VRFSRAPVAISLLVKNPQAKEHGCIHFRDVGDYLTREDKLEQVASFASVEGITQAGGWTHIVPDGHGDWLKQRDEHFGSYIAIGDKSEAAKAIFATHSNGVNTRRDAWAHAMTKEFVREQIERTISSYNHEASRFEAAHADLDRKAREALVDSFVNTDPTKISWSRGLKTEIVRGTRLQFNAERTVVTMYRPFTKCWLYFDRKLNEMVLRMPRFFPSADSVNRVIGVAGVGSRTGFSCVFTDTLPNGDVLEKVQYFPLYVYDTASSDETPDSERAASKKAASPSTPTRRDAITDAGLAHFQSAYPGETISKEDVFYYVYGILHSADYRERYADNLGKELPRIPRVKAAADFWAFSRAGRKLGELHVGYEKVPEYAGATVSEPKKPTTDRKQLYRVEKMRFGRDKEAGGKDKTTIHYNDLVAVSGVPLEAYEYVINGKSAIEWVMERQSVTTDKASGIVKDANAWANETVGDPRYPLSLLLRVITVSLETTKIVASLPALDILDEAPAPGANAPEAPAAPRAAADSAAPSAPSASKAPGLYTLSGGLVLASFDDRRGTFKSDDGDWLMLEFPASLDARRSEIEDAAAEDGVVRLRVRGRGSLDAKSGRLKKLRVEDSEIEHAKN
jgi:predicted helicase